ncbi:MAG: hypothetical protein ACK4MX_01520 [Thermaurantiacus sp.]
MMRLKPKDEKPKLPFKTTHRKQRLAERQRRVELVMSRSLDRAEGFSWSRDRRAPQTGFLASILRLPLHARVAAVASVMVSIGLVGTFLAASRSGLMTVPPIIWVQTGTPLPSGPLSAGADYRTLSDLRMRIVEAEIGGGPESGDLLRMREELMFEQARAEARRGLQAR